MEFDFDRKMYCIFGLNASGKTNLAKDICRKRKAIIFDTLGEYHREFDAWVPKSKSYPGIAYEFEDFIKWVQTQKKYDAIHVSEASTIFPKMKPLMPEMRKFFDTYRHHGVSFGFDCRRPAQLATDLVELSHYIFAFNLKGVNDIKFFNNMNSNIENTIFNLPRYHFVSIDQQRNFAVHAPIPIK